MDCYTDAAPRRKWSLKEQRRKERLFREARTLKLIPKAKESQDGFVPDWENWEQNKYALYFEMGDIHIMQYTSRNIAPKFGFWEDKSVCEEFIDENHDELIWFFTEYKR